MNARSPDAENAVFLMTNSFETGGSEQQFVTLARSLESGGVRTRIGCISSMGPLREGFEEVSEFPVGGNLYGLGSMRARFRLARYLREMNIAVAHAFDFYTNLLMIPAARMARVPVVIGSQRQLGDLLTPGKSRAQLLVLRWCDRVVCNSQAAMVRLVEHGVSPKKIAVIGNGLPPGAFAVTAPALPRFSSQLRVGMIARMNSAAKNHCGFLRAAAWVHGRVPSAEFVLAGDGPLRAELERFAEELGIRHKVHFLGDRRDIPAILASIDISVLPSDSESLSNAILESMAAGVPVVATDVGGNSELVTEERGILVPANNEQRLAEAIERLAVDSALRAEFGRNSKLFAESNFTLETMTRRVRELYAEVLEVKTARRVHVLGANAADRPDPPLRVAIIAASPRYVGGQSVQAEWLLRSWNDDPETEASSIPIDPPFPAILKWAESIPGLRTIVRQPFYLWALWRGLRRVDIAHIFSASYSSFWVAPAPALAMARLLGKYSLIHYHSGEARDHLRRSPAARWLLRKAQRLVVPSDFLVEVFREFGLEAEAVPNIVDTSQFRFRTRLPLRPHLVCTRGFHPYYRVDIVVRAYAEVKRLYPDARLDLVGSGPLELQIRALVRQLNLQDVTFAGVAPRAKIAEFYDRADIFVNASDLDNMPVSILEAFAAGLPVASTAPEGMLYLIDHGNTGLLSPPGDAHALAQNVLTLLGEPSLAGQIIANARSRCENYQWMAVRKQWLQLYRPLRPPVSPAEKVTSVA